MHIHFFSLFIISILSVVIGWVFFPLNAEAQTEDTCGTFGCFEVLDQLPGANIEKSIDQFVSGGSPLVTIANIVFQYGVVVVIAIGLIAIVFGGYVYMTAGGNSSQISSAKIYIGSALAGIAIALTGWLILNTISSQFTDPGEPTLNLPTQSPRP